jgi:predicted Rossmann fold nucleotide-binding protein DprA/Smf involved in DNA uptake
MTAFFASRQCPGTAIRAAMDWAMQQATTRQPVISGFHSPLEQSVLKLLSQAGSPVVAVLARPVIGAKLNPEWKTAIADGRMAVVSATSAAERLTEEQASQRNEMVARLATSIVIAYASAGGGLELQSETWARLGLPVPCRLVQ